MSRDCEFCGETFEAKTHNNKYCCPEHLRLATNKKVMDRYYASRARRQQEGRACSKGCGTSLSRYNPRDVCAKCEAEIATAKKKRLMEILNGLGKPLEN